MDDVDECIHGLGPVSACVICNGREKQQVTQQQADEAAIKYSFRSKYATTCRYCNEPITVSQRLYMTRADTVRCCLAQNYATTDLPDKNWWDK